jgi:hypothetical protein
MKKHLPADAITNELAGASAFFKPQAPPSPAAPQVTENPTASSLPSQSASPPPAQPARQPTRKEPSPKASLLASYPPEQIETIRRTVKKGGRIVSFVRLTQEEKDQLADIVYTYKRRGMKTTENEINRIAINYLLEDYKQRRDESLIALVIGALLA